MRIVILALVFVTVGNGAAKQMPKVLSKVEPEYSEEARVALVNAQVAVGFAVNTSGVAEQIIVKRGCGFGLDEQAVAAVKRWRFQPGLDANGTPMAVATTVEVNFSLLLPDHEGQVSCIHFELPEGSARPTLIKGHMPRNSQDSAGESARIQFQIDEKGAVHDLLVFKTTNQAWAEAMMSQMKNWRFNLDSVHGQSADVKATFDLAEGPAKSRALIPRPLLEYHPLVAIHLQDPSDPQLAAPRLSMPLNDAQFNVHPRMTKFSWEPVSGADSYLLEWDYMYNEVWHAEAKHIDGMAFKVAGTGLSFEFTGAQPGRWRVWPVGFDGKRGNPSEWRTFRYLR